MGNSHCVTDLSYLARLGVTHLLNAAHPGVPNAMSVQPDLTALEGAGVQYLGLQLADESSQAVLPVLGQSGEWIGNSRTTLLLY